ncbi:DUF2802 domain-containing protein [Paraglaciecola marina]|uniref:DUF2802 domain-containing protein n=1 Tax=Paraglaciecola marina TaxID=2500157 RepID=UPI00105EF4C2|nr:DUF2802 domain-containing protein [Paraglaciecola marina]
MSLSLLLGVVALSIAMFCLGLFFKVYKQSKSAEASTHIQSDLISELTREVDQLREEIHEVRSGNFGINKRVKDLMQEIAALQSAQQFLAEQDPQSRFYNKAAKLINEGASLSDIIQECDMPKAEAELLFNLHRDKS